MVYSDYGGAHSTQVAAAVHLGVLPANRVPDKQELMQLPLFDRADSDIHGCLVFMGTDEKGREIYVLGRGPSGITVERAVASGVALAGGDVGSLRFFETLQCVNLWMRIGGFLSRGLGLSRLGRPLVIHGTRKAYMQIVKLVAQVRQLLEVDNEKAEIVASDGCELGAVAGRAVKRGIVPKMQHGPLVEPDSGPHCKEEPPPKEE